MSDQRLPPSQPDRRIAPRYRLMGPVEYMNGDRAGSGTIWDISASGVRVENISTPVHLATQVKLRTSYFPGSFDVQLPAEVVRLTDRGGFGARFVGLGDEHLEFLRRVLPPERRRG